jgi:Ca-activated chloride channel family protein
MDFMKILFLLLQLITNFALHFLREFRGPWRPAALISFFEKLCKGHPTNNSDYKANVKSSAVSIIILKIALIIVQLFFSCQCVASTSWSPINWANNVFFGKKYEATQAYKKQDYDQSLADFHELMNRDPYNPEYNYNVGNLLYRQKKYSDAKESFNRAIKHTEKSSRLAEQAYFNIGNSCYQLEQWQDAITAYKQVLEINEDNEPVRHNLQLALYKLKDEQLQDQQQDENQKKDEKSKDKNKEKSSDCKNKSQEDQSDGDDDQNDEGQSKQDQGKPQKKPGSQKNDGGQEKEDSDGDGKNQDKESQNKSAQQKQQAENKNGDQGDEPKPNESDADETGMNESEKKGSDSKKSPQNKLQDSVSDKENANDAAQNFDQTQGAKEDIQAGRDEQLGQEGTDVGNEKKEMGSVSKKPELKNQLQDQYESKASDDDRLTDYHASVMKTLEDLEEKVQKHIIKNKVALQGAGQGGKNGW